MRAYEELDRATTPWGEILLVRRRVPGAPGEAAYEVKLGGALLMSSLVTDSERALATLALDPALNPALNPALDRELATGRAASRRVLVGGLGLGYTAAEALSQPGVALVEVVDLLPQVIAWHRTGLVPLGTQLCGDPRCTLTQADVFERLAAAPTAPLWDAILLDVDHSPEALLRPEHGAFYGAPGLRRAAEHLAPGGVLGVWSALAPEPAFERRLAQVFTRSRAEAVTFWNVNNDAEEVNSVYLAWR